MTPVVVHILRRPQHAAGDAFELYSDDGTGLLDEAPAITDRPVPLWPGLPAAGGHVRDGHLCGGHLDHAAPDGHLDGVHLLDEHLRPAAALAWHTRPMHFGARRFAVRIRDAAGNTGAASTPAVRVINSSPRAAGALSKSGYAPTTQRLTFVFSPSPDL